MQFVAAILLVIACIAGWLAQLIALPGNWLIVLAAALYTAFGPDASRLAVGWYTVAGLFALAIAGEVLETAAGAAGVKKAGGSRRGALLAIAGSMVGSILGLFVGIPIPIVGSLVAAVVFGAVGAFVGAMLGERWKGRGFDSSLDVGRAAFVGRVWGSIAKIAVSTVMVVVTLGAWCSDCLLSTRGRVIVRSRRRSSRCASGSTRLRAGRLVPSGNGRLPHNRHRCAGRCDRRQR